MQATEGRYLPSTNGRSRLMRLDSAAVLKRFFFAEESLIRGAAGWLAAIESLELKLAVPRCLWESAQVAGALRERVFELRYPSRLMEVGEDAPLLALFEAARHAPDAGAYLQGLVTVLLPALRDAYRDYLGIADDIGDAPTKRFLALALREKEAQIGKLSDLLAAQPVPTAHLQATAGRWSSALALQLQACTTSLLESLPNAPTVCTLPNSRPFQLAQLPARDRRFHLNRFYWPDNVDADYPYGDGLRLQLRSAVSHLNEVWAVETAGAILEAFSGSLGWEFVADAARWTYDEARHTTMGWTRLRDWGFSDAELPLGSYIYLGARDQDPIYRMAMLFYFESKNIGKKIKRTASFASYGDSASQHDMDFDWADEGLHAGYGKRWLTALIEQRGQDRGTFDQLLARCGELVAAVSAAATSEEVADIYEVTNRLIAHAEQLTMTVGGLDG